MAREGCQGDWDGESAGVSRKPDSLQLYCFIFVSLNLFIEIRRLLPPPPPPIIMHTFFKFYFILVTFPLWWFIVNGFLFTQWLACLYLHIVRRLYPVTNVSCPITTCILVTATPWHGSYVWKENCHVKGEWKPQRLQQIMRGVACRGIDHRIIFMAPSWHAHLLVSLMLQLVVGMEYNFYSLFL